MIFLQKWFPLTWSTLANQYPTVAVCSFGPWPTHTPLSVPCRDISKCVVKNPLLKVLLCCFNSIWFLYWSWNSDLPPTLVLYVFDINPYIFKADCILMYLQLVANKYTYLEILFILPYLVAVNLTALDKWQWDSSFFHFYATFYFFRKLERYHHCLLLSHVFLKNIFKRLFKMHMYHAYVY